MLNRLKTGRGRVQESDSTETGDCTDNTESRFYVVIVKDEDDTAIAYFITSVRAMEYGQARVASAGDYASVVIVISLDETFCGLRML